MNASHHCGRHALLWDLGYALERKLCLICRSVAVESTSSLLALVSGEGQFQPLEDVVG